MDLTNVLKPIEEARGLPNACYVSDDYFKTEKQQIFYAGWSALAFISDAPNPGDVCPVDFLGMPLLLVRNKEGDLKVFQNVCRHRGMILIEEACHLRGPIRCPYHSWSYDYDGNLVRTPYVGGVGVDEHENICPENLSLHEIRSHVWQGVVFVDVSGKAPAFKEVHKDLIERWAEFEKPYYIGGQARSPIICRGSIPSSMKSLRLMRIIILNMPLMQGKAAETIGSLSVKMIVNSKISRDLIKFGTSNQSMSLSSRMCFWACTGIMHSPCFLCRKGQKKHWSGLLCFMRTSRSTFLKIKNCSKKTPVFGRAFLMRILVLSRACKKAGTAFISMVGSSRL